VRASASRQPRITPYAPSHRVSPYQLKRGLPPISTVGTGIFFLRLVPNCEGATPAGLEPATSRTEIRCSTIELRSHTNHPWTPLAHNRIVPCQAGMFQSQTCHQIMQHVVLCLMLLHTFMEGLAWANQGTGRAASPGRGGCS